jgi:parallel beta-helix repeat protein/predicted outer membrane repeat protein
LYLPISPVENLKVFYEGGKVKRLSFLVSILTVVILMPIVSVRAAVIKVPGDHHTIQAGINAASSGDTVLVADGQYQENIIFPPGTDIIVESENGPEVTFIDGNSTGSVVTFNNGQWSEWVLDGFTLKNGYAADGGGVYCIDSSVTIINCTISNNTAYQGSGGGIYVGSSLGQEQLSSTGQPVKASHLSVNCEFMSTMRIRDSRVSNNFATVNGGGICSVDSSLITTGSSLSLNTTINYGGGVYYESSESNPNVRMIVLAYRSSLSHNSANEGGGLAIVRYSLPERTVVDDRDVGPDLNPQIVEDSGGKIHVVWESDEDISGAGVYSGIYQITDDGSGWSEPNMINPPNLGADFHPQVIEDSNTLYAVWESTDNVGGSGTDYDILFAVNSGSGWSAPELVNTNGTGDSSNDFHPQIVKDSSGTLHAVWHSWGDTGPTGTDYDVFYASNNGGGWSAPSLLNTNGTSDGLSVDEYPQIIVDSSGKLHAVWHSTANLNDEAGTDYDIFYATNNGGGWSAPNLLNSNGTSDTGTDAYPQIIEDSSGTLHAVWHSSENLDGTAGFDDDIFYASKNGVNWSAPILLNTSGTSDTGDDWDPQIIEASDGSLRAVWESEEDMDEADTDYDIFCATNDGFGWSFPSLLNVNGRIDSGDDYLPQIIEDSSGGIFHVVWESNEDLAGAGTDYDIFYTYGTCGCWSEPSVANPGAASGTLHTTFVGNFADNNGGAIYLEESNMPISNCSISDNDANGFGGGIYCTDSSPMITNCTIADNSAPVGGGLYDHNNSNPILTNCILWANVIDEINYDGEGSLPIVNYCDVKDGWPGTGNIKLDPLFANSQSGDYHLQSASGRWDPNQQLWFTDASTSPCIDTSDPTSKWTSELWPHGKSTNMGAYGGTPEASMSLSNIGSAADFDNNGVVDGDDLSRLAEMWLFEAVLIKEDINRDGKSDLADFAEFFRDWDWEE